MTLGADVAAALPRLRAEAESLMVTPCVLARPDGFTTDPDNGQRVQSWATVWQGSCKVVTSREAREVSLGGQRVTVKPTMVSIPVVAPAASVGYRFTTPKGVFYVTGVEHHSLPVQQRYSTAENQG